MNATKTVKYGEETKKKPPEINVTMVKNRKGTIAQNQHGIPTLNEFFDSGCGYQLIIFETSKYEATAAFLADVKFSLDDY